MESINKNASAGSTGAVRNVAIGDKKYKRSRQAVQSFDPFELILSRASGVKRNGSDTAMFLSPTRDERTASVSIRRTENGSVLLNDFGGDSPASILEAFGLSLASLFPLRSHRDLTDAEKATIRTQNRAAQSARASAVLAMESKVLVAAARTLRDGGVLDDEDQARLELAQQRIDEADAALRKAPQWRPEVRA